MKQKIKKVVFWVVIIISSLLTFRFIRWAGWKGIVCFLIGLFLGAIITIYWAYARGGNKISAIFDLVAGDIYGKTENNKTRKQGSA